MSSTATYEKTISRIFAVSTEAGIFVSASAFPEDEQPMSGFVTRDADGTIVGTIVNESLSSAHDEWKEKNSIQYDFVEKYTKFFQAFFTLIVAAIAMIRNTNITKFVSLLWVTSLFTSSLYNVSYYCSILVYNKIKMPIIAKYHAAEHMAYHAENEFKRVPTINEISRQSMYEFKCATTDSLLIPTAVSVLRSLIITVSIFFITDGFLYLLKTWSNSLWYSLLFVILVTVVAIISKILNKLPSFVTKMLRKESLSLKLLQWAVVSRPGKDEIEVAQQAIRLLYLMDDTIKEDAKGYVFDDVSFDILHKKAIYTFHNGKCGQTTLLEYINSVMAILNAKVEKVDDDMESDVECEDCSDEITVQTIRFDDEEEFAETQK